MSLRRLSVAFARPDLASEYAQQIPTAPPPITTMSSGVPSMSNTGSTAVGRLPVDLENWRV